MIRISKGGAVRRFASFNGFPGAIAFDRVGQFDHRLLVAVQGATAAPTTVFAYDCRGRSEAVVPDAPHLEGGMAVAPRSFGDFGGDLIAVDELGGTIYALAPNGAVRTVAESGIPAGPDIGVESLGFVPGLGRGGIALVADANREALLALSRRQLAEQGVEGGDLLVAAEATPTPTIAVRCDPNCEARQVATGPDTDRGHAEGHIKFFRGR